MNHKERFKDLPDRIFEYLRKHPETIASVAKKVGISKATMARIMNGHIPFVETCCKIDKFLTEQEG